MLHNAFKAIELPGCKVHARVDVFNFPVDFFMMGQLLTIRGDMSQCLITLTPNQQMSQAERMEVKILEAVHSNSPVKQKLDPIKPQL
mgnify:CR=1 FL=1